MNLDSHPIDRELIYKNNTLENIFSSSWQQKELKRYTAIKNIIPVNEYLELENERDRKNIVEYAAARTDKRIKFNGSIDNIETFYTMLLIYKNTSIYKQATAIKVKEIEKEFNTLNQKELYNILHNLHIEKVITWETRADLNQIRFKYNRQ